LIYKS